MSGVGSARGVGRSGIPCTLADASGVYRVLNARQMALGAVVGRMRQGFALEHALRPTRGQSAAMTGVDHILGARGELLIARDLNVFWDGTVGELGGSDVGRLQVRTRSENWHDLPVQKSAHPRDTYVLVVGTGPRFRIVGSILAAVAKQSRWLRNPGGRVDGEAYFVPQGALTAYDRDALRRIALAV